MKHFNWERKRKRKNLVKERMSLIFPRPKLVPSQTSGALAAGGFFRLPGYHLGLYRGDT